MKKTHKYISVISPVFEAEQIVDELVSRITNELEIINKPYEIILIDDGSMDNSWLKIVENGRTNPNVKGIKLSKNFGQAYAISAGLKECIGDCAVVMDCDLQEDPKYISDLLKRFKNGNEIVFSIIKKKKHSIFKNVTSFLYNKLLKILLSRKNQHLKNYSSLSLISRKVINSYVGINDYHRHYLTILKWLGFKNSTIFIEHNKRFKGNSSYSLNKMLKLAINGIVSQTDGLLKLSIYIGFLFSIVGFISILIIIIKFYSTDFNPVGQVLLYLLYFRQV